MGIFSPSWAVCGGMTLAAALAAGAGSWTLQGKLKDGQAAELRAQQLADAVQQARKNAMETDRRAEAQWKADDEQAKREERERAAAGAIDALERNRLRGEIARLERRGAADRTPAGQRTPAEALGAVFRACVARYRELERDAADDRSRGLACEGRYDALTPGM